MPYYRQSGRPRLSLPCQACVVYNLRHARKSSTLFDIDLTPRQKVVLEYFKEQGSITTAEYVQIFIVH